MKNQGQYHNETASPTALIYNNTVYDMLVFCDGSWDQTYRKTLCFLDRNAGAKILYIEKPMAYEPEDNPAKLLLINDHLHVLRPNVASIDAVFRLLPYQVRTKRIAVGWVSSPDFLHFSELIRFKSIINDCSQVSTVTTVTQASEVVVAQKPAFNTPMSRRNKTHFPVAS